MSIVKGVFLAADRVGAAKWARLVQLSLLEVLVAWFIFIQQG